MHRREQWLAVEHDLTAGELSDELTGLLTEQLVDTGVLHGQSEFELVFTGVVRSTVDGGLSSWLRFYRNSLAALERGDAAFAPIHAEAAAQVRGHRLIDLGSCFGFFPLRMAALGHDVLATDLSHSAMRLLDRVSARLRRPLTTLASDAADVGLPDGSADTVTALHLIEHLPTGVLNAVLDEALRLARRRVIVAVPFEEEPRDCYGHLQRFDLPRLHRLADGLTARHPGITAHTYAFHGGWLVLDR
ncbi:SAM-dependent methyltransferase [Mycolicibacterium psychrotolerans]|uniref:SAM-dependent methyltransferase n=1 Tax=Mycolicibacterium psychrotolerans TaxID=216929 RepID=A0A7I7M707_9MYCO|nr:SAM-dependent methyltransferase [Mycolicibacterium psychrotolerans]